MEVAHLRVHPQNLTPKAMNKTVCIVHFNTPELTEAGIKSLRKQCREFYRVVVFDNSDKRPFKAKMKGVQVFDNTKGQIIDFDAELAKYPDRNIQLGKASNDGSFKHILSVQKLWELVPDGFILMESDILIKKDIGFLWDEKWAATGRGEWFHGRRREHDRLYPFLCYMNVPKLVANGARYFDPDRCWNLYPDVNDPRNYWDTGACLLDDIIKTKPALHARLYPNLFDYFEHYNGGSWRNNEDDKKEWIAARRNLWYMPDNANVKIFISTHTDFKPVVYNDVYEVVDSRKYGDNYKGIPGPYYSELLQMKKVSDRKKLPEYIGFCQYRKYFGFMDNVPDIPKIIEKYGAITTAPADLGCSMHEQYGTWGNINDLDLCTEIINEKYPDFSKAWKHALDSRRLRLGTMYILRRGDFKQLVSLMWNVANEFIKRIGGDIDKHVAEHASCYNMQLAGPEYHRRVGGSFAERIASAWIDWRFPEAETFPLAITAEKVPEKPLVNPNAKDNGI